MDFMTWKQSLIDDLENAAAFRAQRAMDKPEDDRARTSAELLYRLASEVKDRSQDDPELAAFWREETELDTVEEPQLDEAHNRCHEARREVLNAIGYEHEPIERLDDLLALFRRQADETISEYRLA